MKHESKVQMLVAIRRTRGLHIFVVLMLLKIFLSFHHLYYVITCCIISLMIALKRSHKRTIVILKILQYLFYLYFEPVSSLGL